MYSNFWLWFESPYISIVEKCVYSSYYDIRDSLSIKS